MLKTTKNEVQEGDILPQLIFEKEGDPNPLLSLDKEKLFDEGILVIKFKNDIIEIPFKNAGSFLEMKLNYEGHDGVGLFFSAHGIYNLLSKA